MRRGQRGMDRHLQRIMDNATDTNGSMDRHVERAVDNYSDANGSITMAQALNVMFPSTGLDEGNIVSTFRQPDQDPMLLNDFGKFPCCCLHVRGMLARVTFSDREPYGPSSSCQPSAAMSAAPGKFSSTILNYWQT